MPDLTKYTYRSDPAIIFNDRSLTGDFKTDEDNWIKLDQYLPDTRVENIEDIRHLEGIEDFESMLSKGIFKLRPRIYANEYGRLAKIIAQVKQAFNPTLTQENSESDEGYLPYDWSEVWTDGVTEEEYDFRVYLKPVEIPRVVKSEADGTATEFEILLKAKDPRRVSQTQKTITLNSASLTGTNDNAGDMPAWPTITITGPTAANPRVTYNQQGEYIQISDTLDAGEVVVVDCKNATIEKDGANAYSLKSSGSKFFNLHGGRITLTAQNLSSGSAVVQYRDSWTL